MSGLLDKKILAELATGLTALRDLVNGDENTIVKMPNGVHVPCVARVAAIHRAKGKTARAVKASRKTENTTVEDLTPEEVSDYVDELDSDGVKELLKHLMWKIQQYD